jgi:hypothetical protein
MSESYKIRANNRLPFDFEDGIKVGGVDITGLKDLGNPGGSALVNYESGRSVQSVLDTSVVLTDYTALRAYNGRATMVRITNDAISGLFKYDPSDTSSADNGGTVILSGSKRWKRVFIGEYLDSWWQPAKNGVSDDSLVYYSIAQILPSGSVLHCVGTGTRIIGIQITFIQDNLTVICDNGVKFKQQNNTLSLDRLFLFTGNYVNISGFDVDGNVTGNPTLAYTGRGELIKVSGSRANIQNSTIRNTHVKDNACGLYI